MEYLIRTDVFGIPSMHDIGHETLHETMHDWALLPGYMMLHAQRPWFVQRLLSFKVTRSA